MDVVTLKKLAWTPFLQIVILSIGTFASFLVAYHFGDVSIYLPFISETGAIVPEMNIFSFSLILGSFVGILVVTYRYLIIIYMLGEEGSRAFQRWNQVAFFSGCTSMIGLAGVAAFPMSSVFIVHLIFAGVHFTFALAYLLLQSYLSYKVKGAAYNSLIFRIRAVFTLLLAMFLGLLVICLPISFFKWLRDHPGRLHALKTPEDIGFRLLFASALFEWLFYITFLGYILTFVLEFWKYELVLSIRPKGEKSPETPRSSS